MPSQKLHIRPNKNMNRNLIDQLMNLEEFSFNNANDQNDSEYEEKINRINEVLCSKPLTNQKFILTKTKNLTMQMKMLKKMLFPI